MAKYTTILLSGGWFRSTVVGDHNADFDGWNNNTPFFDTKEIAAQKHIDYLYQVCNKAILNTTWPNFQTTRTDLTGVYVWWGTSTFVRTSYHALGDLTIRYWTALNSASATTDEIGGVTNFGPGVINNTAATYSITTVASTPLSGAGYIDPPASFVIHDCVATINGQLPIYDSTPTLVKLDLTTKLFFNITEVPNSYTSTLTLSNLTSHALSFDVDFFNSAAEIPYFVYTGNETGYPPDNTPCILTYGIQAGGLGGGFSVADAVDLDSDNFSVYLQSYIIPNSDINLFEIAWLTDGKWYSNPASAIAPLKYKTGVSIVRVDFAEGTRHAVIHPTKTGGFALYEVDINQGPIGIAYIFKHDRTLQARVHVDDLDDYFPGNP